MDTRARLIAAAERLFAERGVDAVSLREINRAAGARNAIALQYHFEDRAGLVQAILSKHDAGVEARRHALLDEYEAGGAPDPRVLVAALARPLAACLGDGAGGPEYLQIHADLLARRDPLLDAEDPTRSVQRWRRLLEPLMDPAALALHRRFTVIVYVAVELGRRARSGPHTDDRLWTSSLIDVASGMVTASVSAETARLTKEREGRRPRAPAQK